MNRPFQIPIFVSICLIISFHLFSQEGDMNSKTPQYLRSSLSMFLLKSDDLPKQDVVLNAWNTYPFPDKYDENKIDNSPINAEQIQLTDEELLKAGYLQDTLSGLKLENAVSNSTSQKKMVKDNKRPVRFVNKSKTLGVLLPSRKEKYGLVIKKIIKEKKIANQLIAHWFGLDKNGEFDPNLTLMQERGYYNASKFEVQVAEGQARGHASLGDAGEQLIKNSFVTFTNLDFYKNEPVARKIRDAAKEKIKKSISSQSEFLKESSLKAADLTYEATKDGYTLLSKTWLYRLSWNDSIAAVFYNTIWDNPEALDTTSLFSLELVGVQYNSSIVLFKLGDTRTEEQVVELALVRNVDNAFAKLQSSYAIFRPAVAITSTDPIIAPIGKKEGLKGGEKFDVLEYQLDQKTGELEWVKTRTVKASRKQIWDNRYNLSDDAEEVQRDKDGNPITGTLFKGSKKIQMGAVIKEAN